MVLQDKILRKRHVKEQEVEVEEDNGGGGGLLSCRGAPTPLLISLALFHASRRECGKGEDELHRLVGSNISIANRA